MENLKKEKFFRSIASIIGTSAGLLVVVLLIGGGAILAGRVWDPQWNPFRPDPDKVVSQALAKMQAVTTLYSDVTLTLTADDLQHTKILININGDFDVQDKENPKSEGEFTYSSMPKERYKIIGNDVYVSVLGSEEWIKFTPLDFGADNNIFKDLTSLADNLSNKNAYTFKSKLPDSVINGQKVYRYAVLAHTQVLADAKVKDFFNKVGELPFQLSIGSKDNYIYEITSEKNIDLSSIFPTVNHTTNISIDIKNSKFNEPATIEAPAAYKDFKEISQKPDNKVPLEHQPIAKNPASLEKSYCTMEERGNTICNNVIVNGGVCGWYDSQKKWFPNECYACRDQNVIYTTKGTCPS